MDAGAADLDQVVADRAEAAEIEFALRVEAAGDPGPLGRQESVRGDDVAARHLPYQQVVAVRVEGVAVQAGFGAVEAGAEFTGEDLVAQPLCGAHVFLADGEGDPVERCGRTVGRDRGFGQCRGGLHRGGLLRYGGDGGERSGDEWWSGQRVHDGLRGRIGKGGCRAVALLRRPGPLLLP